jgi:hypothetical protein
MFSVYGLTIISLHVYSVASPNLREEILVFSAMKLDAVGFLETCLTFVLFGISKNEVFMRVFGLRRETVAGGGEIEY